MIWSTSAKLDDDLLIDGWAVTTPWQFAATSAAVFIIAMAYELIALVRPAPNITAKSRWLFAKDCSLVAARSFLGYMLMLVTMSMNLWLLLFVVLGAVVGHGIVMHRTHRRELLSDSLVLIANEPELAEAQSVREP